MDHQQGVSAPLANSLASDGPEPLRNLGNGDQTMRKFLTLPALALVLATAAGGAYASSERVRVDAPRDQWLSVAQIAEMYTAQGYDVRSVEAEKGSYEIKAVGKDGRRVEIYAHPVTGKLLKQEIDD